MVAAYRRGGVGAGAGLHYANACGHADSASDPRWKIRLLSCSVLFFAPPVALPRVEDACRLAKQYDLARDEALCQANLGLVYLQLGDLNAAKKSFRSGLQTLSGGPRAVALNNLAIAVAFADRAQAQSYLASALACAERPHAVAILSNQAVLQAEGQPLQLPDFSSLATWAGEDCDPPLYERLRFNRARSLADEALPEAALKEIEAADILEEGHRDGALVVAQWARLRRDVYRSLGRPLPRDLDAKAELLERSGERQAWLYRLRWAFCPIPLYGSVEPTGKTHE